MPQEIKRSPFEENLLKALAAIDKQLAREMQRTPKEREEHGVQKWEPIRKRVELTVSTVLNALGDEEIELDSILVMAQAMCKALLLTVEDLGEEGLGKLRAAYCRDAMSNIESDAERALRIFKGEAELN